MDYQRRDSAQLIDVLSAQLLEQFQSRIYRFSVGQGPRIDGRFETTTLEDRAVKTAGAWR